VVYGDRSGKSGTSGPRTTLFDFFQGRIGIEGLEGAQLGSEVDIAVNGSTMPLIVSEYRATGIKPFHEDSHEQQKEENDLWDWFVMQIAGIKTMAPKVQIPENNESLAVASFAKVLSADDVSAIKNGSQIYFLFYFTDDKDRLLFEFCGRLDINAKFNYCSFHNGP
jgi:hypothetical protein